MDVFDIEPDRKNRRRYRRARRMRLPTIFKQDGVWLVIEYTQPGEWWCERLEPQLP